MANHAKLSSLTFLFFAFPWTPQTSSLCNTSLVAHLWVIETEFLLIKSKIPVKSEIDLDKAIMSNKEKI